MADNLNISTSCSSSSRCSNLITPCVNVCVVGGTHGNELNGIYISKDLDREATKHILSAQFPSLRVSTLLGNPSSIAAIGTGAGRRYVDVDLNRCFSLLDLADSSKCLIEQSRAREIDGLLGPKAASRPSIDYIIDIHSTTSATGILICCHPRDLYTQKIASILQSRDQNINVVFWPDKDVSLLPSVSLSGMTLEIGPISHSTCDSLLLQKTKRIIFDIFQIMNRMNSVEDYQSNFSNQPSPPIYASFPLRYNERFATIGYPRDDLGNIIALVHPRWQRVDEMVDIDEGDVDNNAGAALSSQGRSNYFESLSDRNVPMFQRIDDGTDICIDFGSSSSMAESMRCFKVSMGDNYANFEDICGTNYKLYPLFVNEAAYMESDIAMILTVRLEKRGV